MLFPFNGTRGSSASTSTIRCRSTCAHQAMDPSFPTRCVLRYESVPTSDSGFSPTPQPRTPASNPSLEPQQGNMRRSRFGAAKGCQLSTSCARRSATVHNADGLWVNPI